MCTIGVAGLGLIGGSIAKTLKNRNINVIGYDKDVNVLQIAKDQGVISKQSSDNLSCLFSCEVIFICLPVELVPKISIQLSDECDALLTDVGSTKTEILEAVRGAGVKRFIGGHPMAGSDRVGYGASTSQLFENAIYVLCPDVNTNEEDLHKLNQLVELMGAIPLVMSEGRHDEAVAIISHLPHVLASSLCGLVGSRKDLLLNALCAGGFKDITRIASSNARLWAEIILSSKAALYPVISTYIDELNKWKDTLNCSDIDGLIKLFEDGRDFRNMIAISGRGILQELPEIRLEVSDKPGEIARVTAILGNNDINIQNVNIQNNRAYEGGSMRITLQNAHDKSTAVKLLSEQGFVCYD